MKKLKKIGFLFMILNLVWACSRDEENKEIIASISKDITSRTATQIRNYSPNSLVIKYANGVTENDKRLLRNYYSVIKYQLCKHCSDNSIELWMFDSTIQIEPKKETINNPTGGGVGIPTIPNTGRAIAYAEFNYDLEVSSIKSTSKVAPPPIDDYQSYIKNSNDGITVAVFDTGLNPSFGSAAFFPEKFLYNASNEGIPGLYSGWDFVNSDHNSFDDDPNLHGTAVTSIITRYLTNSRISYQILPLKICNSNGKASYFNLLCSLNFALERNARILQMSLGWYNYLENPSNNIFVNLVNQHPNVTIVCSAGNDSLDNDSTSHYPSGYPLNNIIAVASCNPLGTGLSSWSNYGKTTVDYFAKGENIEFLGNIIEGTSFAAPKVTTKVIRYKFNNDVITNEAIKANLSNTGTLFPIANLVYTNKIINP